MTAPANTEAPECVNPAQISESKPKRCGAQLRKKPGQFCQQWAMVGHTRCARHGAKSPRGAAHPSFKHGVYSRVLPKNLKAAYERYLGDPELLSGRRELALLRTRLVLLAGRLGTNESGDTWQTLKRLFAAFRAANTSGDTSGMLAALNAMDGLINRTVNDDGAWADYVAAVERFTQIAARESRRLVEQELTVTAEQVHALVRSITDCVLLNVQDANTRRAIAEHIQRLRVLPAGEINELSGPNLTTVNTSNADSEI